MRLTALLTLADQLEAPGVADPNLANLIRGLRFPHWQELSHLADGLARFWIAADIGQMRPAATRSPKLRKSLVEGEALSRFDYPMSRRTSFKEPVVSPSRSISLRNALERDGSAPCWSKNWIT